MNIEDLQRKWDEFAQNNPFYFISTITKKDDFWQSGVKNYFQYIVPILEKYNVDDKCAVDFGCGVGRYTFPLTQYFKKVIGVDLSKKMIELAKEDAGRRGVTSIEFLATDDFFASKELRASFIYCANVLQHIESIKDIEEIIAFLAKILDGHAYLHFDTRKDSIFYKIKKLLPDFLLPKTLKKGMRRIRRDPAELRDIFTKNNLIIVQESNNETPWHFFLLKKK